MVLTSYGHKIHSLFLPTYRDVHADLRNMNGKQLLEHWFLHGIPEGRRSAPGFWLQHYVNSSLI